MIYRYPRYGELYELWQASGRNVAARAAHVQRAGVARSAGAVAARLVRRGVPRARSRRFARSSPRAATYTLEDQRLLGRKQIEVIGNVHSRLPRVRRARARSRSRRRRSITRSCRCCAIRKIAEVSHPYVPLPPRFRYPQDARDQLETAREYMTAEHRRQPRGLWPSEGSVSDEALRSPPRPASSGPRPTTACSAARSNHDAGPSSRPTGLICGSRTAARCTCIFRDHYLSDLIGFVYSRMGAAEAADAFPRPHPRELRADSGAAAATRWCPSFSTARTPGNITSAAAGRFCASCTAASRTIRSMTALTVSEALGALKPQPLDHIFPGSWINANFDIWIGAEEDNKAWEYLLRARQTYDRDAITGRAAAEERTRLAYEELLIAEGSDWCWWYGPEHDSANRAEFDQLFRDHLANVYTAAGSAAAGGAVAADSASDRCTEFHQTPTGPVSATIDGEVTSYFEWLGAGVYRVDNRSGAMHGQRFFVQELRYGSDGQNLYLRLDFVESTDQHAAWNGIANQRAAGTPGPRHRSASSPLHGTAEGSRPLAAACAR